MAANKPTKTIKNPGNFKVTDLHLRSIKRLASQGMNVSAIAIDIKIHRKTVMDNPDCKKAFLAGRAALHKKITKTVLKRSGTDDKFTTDKMLAYAADKIGVFDGELIFDPPDTPEDAKKIMGQVLSSRAAGMISQRKADDIMKILESFVKIIDVHELRKEIDELKEILDVKSIDL